MTREITSVQNPRIKQALRLRDRRGRHQQGRFLIDGVREIRRALGSKGTSPLFVPPVRSASSVQLVEVFYCSDLCQGPEVQELYSGFQQLNVPLWSVTKAVMEKLAFGERGEGLVAVAKAGEPRLSDLRLPEDPLVAVLEGVEKPGNLGAVLRSADAAGVSAVIAADLRTDLYNPNAIRASLGTIFTVPVAVASTTETQHWLRQTGLSVYAACPSGALPYTEVDYRGPTAFVLGAEAQGLSSSWQEAVSGRSTHQHSHQTLEDQTKAPLAIQRTNQPSTQATTAARAQNSRIIGVTIPMVGVADSLNVSVTAAILFYEALRQRNLTGS